ncbi:hypothetical protein P6144_17490 [Sphingomonas sp. HITSZ_GF]|uniref:hypothetical protein n=1 Tax=Sphingomonas sp. HITSZ_GF TaxID=3037247 RepID=UPI00240E4032|nr:hypothetical protein [Sphingomonas sp. HITSZ_GF]MDG2535459.1 hypothetical protein [Sphingomonas sp. HITSZ_GF]
MKAVLLATAALLAPLPAFAQDHSGHAMPGMDMPAPAPTPTPVPAPAPAPQDHAGHAMPGMEMPAPAPTPAPAPQDHSMHDMGGMEGNDAGFMPTGTLRRSAAGSGTSLLPVPDRMRGGFHVPTGDWMLMAMGSASLAYTDQGGPRGEDATYTANMAMFQAVRSWQGGTKLTFDTMLSLDAINGQRGYPNLFATGETAHGEPLVDRQHPHDLFMELTARLDLPLGGGVTGFVYGGPVGEPALGPSAFVHRKSARYLPLSPISHHWFDSTHISYGVVTGGVTTSRFQIEASAFRGREPDEQRWDIETPKLDSWSLRASWTPSPDWVVQLSHGRLNDPEAMHAGQDENRTTASVQYGGDNGLSAMLAFSAKDRVPGNTLTAWLAEVNWDLSRHHSLFGRIENVANDELFPDHADPLHDTKFRVTRFETGYAYRIPLSDKGEIALGGSLAAYAKPAALDAAYGKAPISYTLFARLGLGM